MMALTSSTAQASSLAPASTFNFEQFFDSSTHQASVDRRTISETMNPGGDKYVGGIIKIKSKAADQFSYVNAIVASCDASAMILLRSKVFDSQDQPIATIREPILLRSAEVGSVNHAVLTLLCSSETGSFDGSHLRDFWLTPEDIISLAPRADVKEL
jgi:hypothetical protein